MNKQNYLELKVPVSQKAVWFRRLRKALAKTGVPVKWKKDLYHITVAFMKDDQHVEALKTAFGKILFNTEAFQLTLDKVGVFKTMSGKELIINLTSSEPGERFMSLVESLRCEVGKIGVKLESDFRLHITLGRIDVNLASLEQVEEVVKKIYVPSFSLTIKDAEYSYYKGGRIQKYPLKRPSI